MEIRRAARRHGVADEDIVHGIEHALVGYALAEREGDPRRTLVLGPDRSGNMLEIVVLEIDDGRRLAIHAMRMRHGYDQLLPGQL